MFARFVAFVCLSQFALCSRLPEPVVPQKHTLVVFLKGAEALSPGSTLAMKAELRDLMGPAGYQVQFQTADSRGPVSGDLVVMEFKGTCDSRRAPAAIPSSSSDLATTTVVDGHVSPFSRVNCSLISTMLVPELAALHPTMRDVLYGRALARVVGHELYHILADETGHAGSGVAKSSFTTEDLLRAHMDFEHTALARMTKDPVYIAVARNR